MVACGEVEPTQNTADARDPGASVDAQVGVQPDAMAAQPDAVPPDAEPNCTSESDTAFCNRLGAECGSLSAADNCNAPRTAMCGSCTALGDTCGGGGVENMCGCLPPVGIDTSAAGSTVAGVGASTMRAQSFTVGQNTSLETIVLDAGYPSNQGSGLVTLTLYRATASGANPNSGDRLATRSWLLSDTTFSNAGSASQAVNAFDVSSWGITLESGEVYWLVLSSSINYIYMITYGDSAGTPGEGYPGGNSSYFNGTTWIDQPDYDFDIQINPCP